MNLSAVKKINFNELGANAKLQFTGLDPNDPSRWPVLPKALLLSSIVIGVVAGLWFFWLSTLDESLTAEMAKEQTLKEEYRSKLGQAINLDELKRQLEQVRQYVVQLEKQLPSKAEMDELLSNINQAGVARNLQFEYFKPGQVIVREYYAELPIALKISGTYHDIGRFASDIAHFSRIVTFGDASISAAKERGQTLILEGIARTYRYLDPEEVAAQKKALVGAGPKK
jgi:type IV pilus assembly protein PilO